MSSVHYVLHQKDAAFNETVPVSPFSFLAQKSSSCEESGQSKTDKLIYQSDLVKTF